MGATQEDRSRSQDRLCPSLMVREMWRCDKITPNRWQAQMHYAKRIVQWERLKKIEAAARTAFAHLSWLEKCGDLTREEEPMMNELREALTSKKKEEE